MRIRTATLLVWCAAGLALADSPPGRPPVAPYEVAGLQTPATQIDRIVFDHLRKRGIQPAYPCSDAVFLRRAYIDVIGTLPTATEAAEFLADPSPNKRTALIDRLLQRPEFADYWAMKWGDVLRIKAEFPVNLWPNAVQAYYRWVWESVRDNKPYDRFCRELLTSSGSNFRVPPVNFYRAVQSKKPEGIAAAVALTFLCSRAEKWPKERLDGMAAFFSQVAYKSTYEWKEEIVFFDPDKPLSGRPIFPDGTEAKIPAGTDPREVFANWLISPKNPYFARAAVNRVWFWLMGRGIIHEPDDIRPDNPPSIPELLAYLEKEFVASGYDQKRLFRLILNSQVYQLSSIPASNHPDAETCFASYCVRRMDAEVLIDAICQITGTTERYQSPIPEPFTYIPETNRTITLADGSITSSFLELFGRPSRDSGTLSERINRISTEQRLHLLNSSHINRKITQGPKMVALARQGGTPEEVAKRLYLTFLSRYPTEEEIRRYTEYVSASVKPQEAFEDLAWTLVNSVEFLYRH